MKEFKKTALLAAEKAGKILIKNLGKVKQGGRGDGGAGSDE